MQTYRLICHPDTPALKVRSVDAYVVRNRDNYVHVRWRVKGTRALIVPEFVGSGRADGLWQTTCFELFLGAQNSDSYSEFNFSPSGRWAAYDFASYREEMAARPMAPPPQAQDRRHAHILTYDVQLRASTLPPRPLNIGLTAVIEEEGGVKSYWAIAHALQSENGGAPDFHSPTCFAATLPPPENP